MLALIAKMFGHAHRRPGAAAAHQRRAVRGGRDDDRAAHPLGAEHVFNEITQLAAALADQRKHYHIGLHFAAQMAQKAGFADPGAGKKPDPLPPDNRQHGVEHRHPGFQPRAKPPALGGAGRIGLNRPCFWPAHQGAAIKRLSEWVNNPADPVVIRRDYIGLHQRCAVPK